MLIKATFNNSNKKRWVYLLFFIPITLISCWSGTGDDSFYENYGSLSPVIMDRASFENSISFENPIEMRKTGKIYIKDDLVFINDVNRGFHVYQYENPETPVAIGYIKVPGATDLAIRNNLIYINQAVDLVTISFDSNQNFEILNRVRNVFPQKTSLYAYNYEISENDVIVDFVERF
ncbi:MAG: hypothetical protein ACOVLC_02790 [Flavobacterium sp.]